ncbi:MAG: rod shape-determining protein MreD [Lachnospiraceae bacterium]|nr:rod shape-determining protein MreD [Lachnospiraceae bacterium]
MRRIIEIAGVIICFVLQCTFFQAVSFAGIVPNLLIIITSCAGFIGGKRDGMITGFMAGLLTDIFYGNVIGINALIFLYIGYINGFGNRVFYPEDLKFPMVFIALSDISCLFLQYFFGFLFRARLELPFYFAHIMIPEIIYTMVVTIIIYMPVRGLVNRIYDRRREIQ